MAEAPLPPLDPREFAAVRALRRAGWRGVLLGADRRALALGAAVLLLGIPALAACGEIQPVTINQIGRYCALALVAIGLDLVWGYAGILSLCQAAFFTLGGYGMAMYLVMQCPPSASGLPPQLEQVSSAAGAKVLPWFWEPFASGWFALGAVLVVPALLAGLFGWMAFRSRIKGVYFSIITQALTIALCMLFAQNLMMLGGTNGLNDYHTIAGFSVKEHGTRFALYLASVLALIGATALALWLVRTRFGRVLVAVRDSEARLRFAGYRPVAYKTAIFAIGALLGAIGGALYVPQTGIITPSNMDVVPSLMVVVAVAVGGRGTVVGAVVGSLLLSVLESQLTTRVPSMWPFVLGGMFVAVVLFMPDGLVGQWRKLIARAKGSAA